MARAQAGIPGISVSIETEDYVIITRGDRKVFVHFNDRDGKVFAKVSGAGESPLGRIQRILEATDIGTPRGVNSGRSSLRERVTACKHEMWHVGLDTLIRCVDCSEVANKEYFKGRAK